MADCSVESFIGMSWQERDKVLLKERNRKSFMTCVHAYLESADPCDVPDDVITDVVNWLQNFKRQYRGYLSII